jgi:wyosine [tRNA(Phe)-imidazoG37] synthetase (radical SAM superfamily)
MEGEDSKERESASGYVFGPVPSRRLGRSLGIDLVPLKTCTFDCIYCQLGRTQNKTVERRAYVPGKVVIQELEKKLSSLSSPPDYITFSGSGEPTLNSEIGWLINEINQISKIPIAVLTNGSLLHLETVRNALLNANLVIPSLDAASAQLFKFINRPHHSLHFRQILSGLKEFRREFGGQVWVEVMLCGGINDGPQEIQRLREAIECIGPDRIQLNTVIRPPAEEFAYPLSADQMEKVRNIWGAEAEIIPDFPQMEEQLASRARDEEIMDLLKRRPCTAEEISRALGYKLDSVLQCLSELNREHVIDYRMFHDRCYYERNLNR